MRIWRQVFFCSLGGIIEWYDFWVFAALSPLISKLFFSHLGHFDAMLNTFLVFFSGYLVRPIGGLFFGLIGDRVGRKTAMLSTIFLMAVSTALIGCIPLGRSFSVLLLVLLRLLQGFSASGEYAGGVVLLYESVDEKYKQFKTSFSIAAPSIGAVLGSFVVVLSAYFVHADFAWRLPFLIALPLGLLAYTLRTKLADSLQFDAKAHAGNRPLITLFSTHQWQVLWLILAYIYGNISFYMNLIYFNNYNVSVGRITTHQAFLLTSLATFSEMSGILIFSLISDLLGGKKVMMAALLFSLIFAYPLFDLVFSGSFQMMLFAQILLTLFLGAFVGCLPYFSASAFPVGVRYTGVALCLNIVPALIGSLTPIVASYLVKFTHNPVSPILLYLGGCVLTFLGLLKLRRVADR